MTSDWITPAEAVEMVVRHHYSRKQGGSHHRVRMALIGALRHGQIGWKCQRLDEHFTDDAGNHFNPHGSGTAEEPSCGWPNDLWIASLARDRVLWRNNSFTSHGELTMLDAPSDVRRWLDANGQFRASWCRAADDVAFSSADVRDVLMGAGWQIWITKVHHPDARRGISEKHRRALVDLIAMATRAPELFTSARSIADHVADAFAAQGVTLDGSDLGKLASMIFHACNVVPDEPAPID